ncbi:helix-turn-helix transcriptional regulator [Actinosynnema sp. CA-299493]
MLEAAGVRLAHEIRRRRIQAGLSQPQLATKIGYTRQYVSLAERLDHNLPSVDLVKALDHVLDANGSLIALREQGKRNQKQLHQQVMSKRASRIEATAVPVTQAAEPGTVEELLMSAAEESSAFLTWAESTNVGDLTVDQMHAEIRRIAHSYLKVPTLPLFARTKALRDRAFTLLSGHQDPRHTRELYAAAGWSLTVLSWISVDLGRADAAEDHARAAWMCAERADHHALRAWVRATQHTASFWRQDYATAARYAADGLNYTTTGTAKLFLSSALALDLARGGDSEGAGIALRRAQSIAETAARVEDELAGPLMCSVDRAGSLWSDTELAMGRAEDALAFADRAVAEFEAAPRERRNPGSERMTRLQQVKAHLVLGDLAAAEDALRPVLDTPAAHRVRPLVHRVTEAGELTARTGHTSDPAAKRILEAIVDFRADTATRELTA